MRDLCNDDKTCEPVRGEQSLVGTRRQKGRLTRSGCSALRPAGVAQGAGWIFLLFPTRSPQQVNPREARLTRTLPGPRLSRLRRHLDLCPAALEAEH